MKNTIIQGHVIDVLKELPADYFQMVCTSPPYWGLRDYDIEPVVWGGQLECKHEWEQLERADMTGGVKNKTVSGWSGGSRGKNTVFKTIKSAFCVKCNAWLGCLGLEPTLELWIEHIVEIFQEVRRVLRPDGILWLNLGDAYVNKSPCGGLHPSNDFSRHKGRLSAKAAQEGVERQFPAGLKPKDLCGMPGRAARALQDDGWWLRRDIIWWKPNPMPESAQDRPATTHEYIFLMTKRGQYTFYESDDRALMQSVWMFPSRGTTEKHYATFPNELPSRCIRLSTVEGDRVLDPFAGIGTTVSVAKFSGRQGVGIEINPEYVEIAERRLAQESLL